MSIAQEHVIRAYTEEDAIRKAMLHFKRVKKIEKITAGFKPSGAKVFSRKSAGAKKWVTKYYLYTFDSKGVNNQGDEVYVGMKFQKDLGNVTKKESLEEAQKLASELSQPVTVRIVRVLEEGSNIVGDAIPNGGILGEYKVTGVPRTVGNLRINDVQDVIESEAVSTPAEKEEEETISEVDATA